MPWTAVEASQLRWAATVSIYCPADVELRQHGLFVLGPPSVVAGALLGRALGQGIAHARASRIAAPQWRVAGHGEVILTEDLLVARGITNFDVHVPFRTITSWRDTPGGVELERVGWAPLRADVHDPSSFRQWFAYLATDKTWRPPVLTTPQVCRPIVEWCQQDPRLTFGLPEGWSAASAEWLAGLTEDFAPHGRAIAGARRFSPPLTLNMFIVELFPSEELAPEMIERTADEVAAQMAMGADASFTDPVELLDVDSERATLFHLTHPKVGPADVAHFFVTHAGCLYKGTFFVGPTPAGDG
jgi:hypothetical protein